MNSYQKFLESKRHSIGDAGFKATYFPDIAFDFQSFVIEKAIQKGRQALYLDTGLGKTIIELAIAQNIVKKTNKRVLIMTPLAVAFQFLLEAEKIGIDDIEYSKDGKHSKKIVVCNYERLHYFNPDDFSGVICDECFHGDTPVGVIENGKRRQKPIRSVRKGDLINNASGIDKVGDVHRRRIKCAVKVKIGKDTITASENHPFFTQRGWVSAIDLKPADSVIKTVAALRLVSDRIPAGRVQRIDATFLREVLLSEMAYEATSRSGKGALSRSGGPSRSESAEVATVGRTGGLGGIGTCEKSKSDGRLGLSIESEPNIESDETQTFRAWRKRDGFDSSAENAFGLATEWVGGRVCRVVGETKSRLSVALQAGLSKSRIDVRDRGGWSQPQIEKRPGQKERRNADFVRVDGIEILEQGHPEFESMRSPDGFVYFYDIGATRHPSYSVNGLLVHNSSILKNFEGATKNAITAFVKKTKYRFLATATPSPNDYIELGTSSEALGMLGYMDMLNRFFANNQNNTIKATGLHRMGAEWYLKPHAETAFWQWVSQWAISVRKPSDLGFSDEKYILPALHEKQHVVNNTKPLIVDGQARLFNEPAINFRELKAEVRATLNQRCERAVELAANHETSVYWVNLNDEAAAIRRLDTDTVEIQGKMDIDKKEEILLAFAKREVKKLITKTSITAFGLNWQHCNHTTYFPTYSYEQYYQAIRRFWRFGQRNQVNVDLVLSDGQTRVMDALLAKKAKADDMFTKLSQNVNSIYEIEKQEFAEKIVKPKF